MTVRKLHLWLGIGAVVFGLLLGFVAIPQWVTSPSNVPKIVLSPLFWPYCLVVLTIVIGIGLLLSAGHATQTVETVAPDPGGWLRLAGTAAIMAVTLPLITYLGMVWTAMLAFIAMALLLRTRYPVTALICAVVVPLALYVFFAHVAGVAVPQGVLVRLP